MEEEENRRRGIDLTNRCDEKIKSSCGLGYFSPITSNRGELAETSLMI
jgi:hypothetical protein